ncbi:class II SORL domain-containing protein [Methanolapillus millepedarum]|uniref:Superoxide reductase n=1 Tax=Methanolapillus millepedarum TaxID=3028296 RepID=A0AA96ZTT1_9EURY|nr:Putative superoxide reductase [Methanosarcinaceae archaeon Ac7]
MDFTTLFKAPESEGKEKHVPIIEILKNHGGKNETLVLVTVGKEVPHPNTIEHHIVWIELFGIKKDTNQVICLGHQNFAPTFTEPTSKFKVKIDDFKALGALAYCNIHGVWKNTLDL